MYPRKEFKIGEKVTYRPYFAGNKMYVIQTSRGNIWGNDPNDDRVFYHLSKEKDGQVTTVTTGRSIKESYLYVPIEVEDAGGML